MLIGVKAASINKADYDPHSWKTIHRAPFRRRSPQTQGHDSGADVSGRIEALGKGVTRFKTGDEVFGNLSKSGRGAYAE